MPDASGKSRGAFQLILIPQTEDILHIEQGRLRSMSCLQHAYNGVSAGGFLVMFSRIHVLTFSFIALAAQRRSPIIGSLRKDVKTLRGVAETAPDIFLSRHCERQTQLLLGCVCKKLKRSSSVLL
jgi:hypothetical protein